MDLSYLITPAMEAYLNEVQATNDAYWKKQNYTFAPPPKFVIETGKRFHKIIECRIDFNGKVQGMNVHCFVEIATGDIYKAASIKAPAKGVRGNIQNDKKPLTGMDYYR